MTENVKPIEFTRRIDVKEVKGEVTLILKNEKTGEIEEIKEHNMMTNAIAEMLVNCGWMNADNLDKSNLVEQLLGGVLLLDDELDENEDLVYVPEGVGMTANGAVGTVNNGVPTELGSYSSTESGWQQDGSYVEVYDWTTSQGNGTIACVCATNKEFGYGGAGNVISGGVASRMTLSLVGSGTGYYVTGMPCKVSLEDSTCYTVDFSDYANNKIKIRKYLLPINEINIKGTPSSPTLLSESEINMPSSLATWMQTIRTSTDWGVFTCVDYGVMADIGGKVAVLNCPRSASDVWGTNYTQKLWEIDPVNETVTETTLLNTSGETLKGMCLPTWVDENTLVWVDGYIYQSSYNSYVDSTAVYSMRRENGTWGTIQSCENPNGIATSYVTASGYPSKIQANPATAFMPCGKLYFTGQRSNVLIFDFDKNEISWTNNSVSNGYRRFPTDHPLISWWMQSENNGYTLRLIRNQNCIATIFNLATPVTKTSEKTMKLLYRFTFEEEPEEGTSTS